MFSIYTSAYNLENGLFPYWKDALIRFRNFADQVCVSTTTDCKDNTVSMLTDFCNDNDIKLVITDVKFSDFKFDGLLKNAALQETVQPGKILLDLDEIIPLSTKPNWIKSFEELCNQNEYAAFLIPSINLCKTQYEYKDIGYKFYLHTAGFYRGVVNFAKQPDGKIDIRKSDTTELIDSYGNLVRSMAYPNDLDSIRNRNIPYVFHFWGTNINNRIKQNEFWKPHWENRAGKEVNDIVLNAKGIEDIVTKRHYLPLL